MRLGFYSDRVFNYASLEVNRVKVKPGRDQTGLSLYDLLQRLYTFQPFTRKSAT